MSRTEQHPLVTAPLPAGLHTRGHLHHLPSGCKACRAGGPTAQLLLSPRGLVLVIRGFRIWELIHLLIKAYLSAPNNTRRAFLAICRHEDPSTHLLS